MGEREGGGTLKCNCADVINFLAGHVLMGLEQKDSRSASCNFLKVHHIQIKCGRRQ